MNRVAICTTTIFEIDSFLSSYVQNINYFDHRKDVTIIIAGDRKSPKSCIEISKKYIKQGIDVRFISLAWQSDYLKRYPYIGAIIPENSDNRRNVAYLLALEEGADIIVSVDDDNIPLQNIDFVGEHMKVGTCQTLPVAVGKDGWFNLCSLLFPQSSGLQDDRLYPRGFPYSKRKMGTDRIDNHICSNVGINVGLWTLDPDVDAISRLYASPHISHWGGQNVFLNAETRCPINTQNTALSREAMAAYYYIRMGVPLSGMRLDRFGDIFSGYFLQLCANAVGDGIKIGSPITEHRRHKHNLLIDLYNELAGIMILEDMVEFLSKTHLPGQSYVTAYVALSHRIEDFAKSAEGFIWQDETRKYFIEVAKYMRIWVDAISNLK
jgi:hypothetical protein